MSANKDVKYTVVKDFEVLGTKYKVGDELVYKKISYKAQILKDSGFIQEKEDGIATKIVKKIKGA